MNTGKATMKATYSVTVAAEARDELATMERFATYVDGQMDESIEVEHKGSHVTLTFTKSKRGISTRRIAAQTARDLVQNFREVDAARAKDQAIWIEKNGTPTDARIGTDVVTRCAGHIVRARIYGINTSTAGSFDRQHYICEFISHLKSGNTWLLLDAGQDWSIEAGQKFNCSEMNIIEATESVEKEVTA